MLTSEPDAALGTSSGASEYAQACGEHSEAAETLLDGEAYGERDAPLKLSPGTKIGRYVSIEQLGSGGMGVVWAAYDPELDRRVAVKVLRADGRSQRRREVARLRLQREAQAMAKLSHVNVVTVHDVGTHEPEEGPQDAEVAERHREQELVGLLRLAATKLS